MVCPCTINLPIIEKYPHHIDLIFGLGIYDIYPFIDPSHDGVFVPFTSQFYYLSFNLIAQHFFKKNKKWNHKNNPKKCMESPPPFSLKCCAPIIQKNQSNTCLKKREEI